MNNTDYIIDILYDIISNIKDPEFNKSYEELKIIKRKYISVSKNKIIIYWKPTVKTCSFANQIGLSIYYAYQEYFPNKKIFKLFIYIYKNLHDNYKEINKIVNDKERTIAALENRELNNFILGLINFYKY